MAVQNNDPHGPLPQEDADGRLRLNQTGANYAQVAAGAFMVSCIALYSMFYWGGRFTGNILHISYDPAQVVLDTWLRLIGSSGIALIPILPFLYWRLIFPRDLVVDDEGITARKCAQMKRLRWEEIHAINLIQVPVDGDGWTKTMTIVEGPAIKLSWMPVCGVDPQALAAYLNARRAKARSAGQSN